MSDRFEVLPFGTVLEEAAAFATPLELTVTCSPRHGVDSTIGVAEQLSALGHRAVVHVAARMIRDRDHLDVVLARLAAGGMDDMFLVGGDGPESLGPYSSAVELLEVVQAHPLRPRRVGIGAYPEGHPLIAEPVLREALRAKAQWADYVTSQMCFDPGVLIRWVEELRSDGVTLPMYIGVPGQVDRRRLLEISVRVGVGTSIGMIRKQRGLRHLLGRPRHAAEELHVAIAPLVGQTDHGIAGFQYFTFNNLSATVGWSRRRSKTDEEAVLHG
ncbi:MAG TPA: methylenetetrahydrofolate reductase [Baekduia sp.]|nr:methylenetetrahydrofolate reductase [Baekduia sp.]